MKRFALLALMLLSAAVARAESPVTGTPWTLQDCIAYALDHNLTVRQSALAVDQRTIELGTARARVLPGVSASASQNFSFGRGLTADNTYANTNTTNLGLSLGGDMTLFNGLRIKNNIELGKLNLQAATEDLEKARELQNFSQEVINVICNFRGNIVGGKRIMKLIGLDLGPNRVPWRNLTDEEEAAMKAQLDQINFFSRCNVL